MTLVVGIGTSRGASAGAVRSLLDRVLGGHGLDPELVCAFASVDRCAGEPGLLAAIAPAPLRTYPATTLDAIVVPHPSERVRAATGTRSVAEAAALVAAAEIAAPRGARIRLIVGKTIGDGVTVAVADLRAPRPVPVRPA